MSSDGQRAGQIARAENLQTGFQLLHNAELIQRIEVERIAFDSRGPFEYALSTMRADRYEIRSTLYV